MCFQLDFEILDTPAEHSPQSPLQRLPWGPESQERHAEEACRVLAFKSQAAASCFSCIFSFFLYRVRSRREQIRGFWTESQAQKEEREGPEYPDSGIYACLCTPGARRARVWGSTAAHGSQAGVDVRGGVCNVGKLGIQCRPVHLLVQIKFYWNTTSLALM